MGNEYYNNGASAESRPFIVYAREIKDRDVDVEQFTGAGFKYENFNSLELEPVM